MKAALREQVQNLDQAVAQALAENAKLALSLEAASANPHRPTSDNGQMDQGCPVRDCSAPPLSNQLTIGALYRLPLTKPAVP